VAGPPFRAYFADAHLVGAGQQFKSQFRLAASAAVRSNVYTAIRFERRDDGTVWYAVYSDGNANGVLSADIRSGRDRLVSGPFPLAAGAPGVRVGINPMSPRRLRTTASCPETRSASGRSDILSFSPLGTATPGTCLPRRRRRAGPRCGSPAAAPASAS